MKRRVAVTGIGAVSPLGVGKNEFWDGLCRGKSGINRITLFDPSPYRTQIAAEVKEFDPLDYLDKKEAKYMDRVCHLSLAATDHAIQDADLKLSEDTGIIIGTGIGGITSDDIQHDYYNLKGPRFVQPMAIPMIMCNAIASHISMRYGHVKLLWIWRE